MARPGRMILISTCAALLVGATIPAQAAPRMGAHRAVNAYDGNWSVVIRTTRGDCPASVRAGVQIFEGRVLGGDAGYQVEGRVAANGAVRVNVSADGQGAGGYGHLSRAIGQGVWKAWSGKCAGQWTAERRG